MPFAVCKQFGFNYSFGCGFFLGVIRLYCARFEHLHNKVWCKDFCSFGFEASEIE
jgi:hypothetical protein